MSDIREHKMTCPTGCGGILLVTAWIGDNHGGEPFLCGEARCSNKDCLFEMDVRRPDSNGDIDTFGFIDMLADLSFHADVGRTWRTIWRSFKEAEDGE